MVNEFVATNNILLNMIMSKTRMKTRLHTVLFVTWFLFLSEPGEKVYIKILLHLYANSFDKHTKEKN